MENQKAAEDSHNRENINSPLNNTSFIDQACLVEMAGWLDEMPCFFFFFWFLWTATLSWSIKKTQKNLTISSHLDPSWSIMHTSVIQMLQWNNIPVQRKDILQLCLLCPPGLLLFHFTPTFNRLHLVIRSPFITNYFCSQQKKLNVKLKLIWNRNSCWCFNINACVSFYR